MAEEKKQAALKIVIDDGSQRIPIENMNGDEIGVFYFHPTDVAIINRYNESVSKIDDVVKPLEDINISATGEAEDSTDEAAVKALNEAEKRLFDLCDYIFGGNMSEAFFGKMHPFSPVGGEFYFEKALTAVGSFISGQFDAETAKISKRVSKYTGKYQRKK